MLNTLRGQARPKYALHNTSIMKVVNSIMGVNYASLFWCKAY